MVLRGYSGIVDCAARAAAEPSFLGAVPDGLRRSASTRRVSARARPPAPVSIRKRYGPLPLTKTRTPGRTPSHRIIGTVAEPGHFSDARAASALGDRTNAVKSKMN